MKRIVWIIVLIIIVIVGFFIWGRRANRVSAPTGANVVPGNDTTAAINQDLESLNINDLDQEFQSIDSDLNQL